MHANSKRNVWFACKDCAAAALLPLAYFSFLLAWYDVVNEL